MNTRLKQLIIGLVLAIFASTGQAQLSSQTQHLLPEEEAFMVIHADNLSQFSVDEFISSHKKRARKCIMTMMIFETDQPENSGIVETDSDGVVVKFHEKVENPPGNLANGAVYIFEPEIF